MAVICPTITASEPHAYREQMERVEPFAQRIHIDLMDGQFATPTSPKLKQVWWPAGTMGDVHLMYRRPMDYIEQLIKLHPHLVIIHFEASVEHMHFAARLHREGIKTGLAILQDTSVETIQDVMHSFDHILVFSGHLGHHGGKADLSLLAKVKAIREYHPEAEIGWDGGVNLDNAQQLIAGGVDILNVGGFIHNAKNPAEAYRQLKTVVIH